MMHWMLFLSVFGFGFQYVISTDIDDSGPVIPLTDKTFDEFVLKSDVSFLVEFYAPWCGHCKKLAPIYEEAARGLLDKLDLGKVDCTAESALRAKYKIKSFPTIIFFRDGETRPYKGAKTAEAIIEFGNDMLAPPVGVITAEAFDDLRGKKSVVMIYLGLETSDSAQVFDTVAYRLQGMLKFVIPDQNDQNRKLDEELRAQHATDIEPSVPLVMAFSKGSDSVIFSGVFDVDTLTIWVRQNSLPLVAELSPSNFEDITNAGKLNVFTVTDPLDKRSQAYVDVFIKVAQKYKGEFIFANLNGIEFHDYVTKFGFSSSDDMPSTFVLDHPNELFYLDPALHNNHTQDDDEDDDEDDDDDENFAFSEEEQSELLTRMDSFMAEVKAGRIVARSMTAWYSPARYIKALEKWLSQFDETYFMIVVIVGVVLFFSLFLAFLIFCDSDPEEMEEESQILENDNDSVVTDNHESDPNLRRRAKQRKQEPNSEIPTMSKDSR